MTHLAWLNDNKRSNFKIAIDNNKNVIGCIHKYKTNIETNAGLLEFTVLHDLAASENHKGVGQKLLREEIKSNNPLILAHVTGKVAKTYKNIGSITVPIIVRLQGTNAVEAKKIIDNSGLKVISAISLQSAADGVKAVLN